MGMTSSTANSSGAEAWRPPKYDDGKPIQSLSSVAHTAIVVHNNTGHPLAVNWLDYHGGYKHYIDIPSGACKPLYTFMTHPWSFELKTVPQLNKYLVVRGTKQQVLFPAATPTEYHIELASDIPWSTVRHLTHWSKAHPLFCSQVRAVLLCHHNLHRAPQALLPLRTNNNLVNTTQRRSPTPIKLALACLPVPNAGPGSYNKPAKPSHGRPQPSSDSPLPSPCGTPVSTTGLQDLPLDVLLHIFSHLAPAIPDVAPTRQSDMVLPSGALLDQHNHDAAIIQAQLAAGQPLHVAQD